VYAILINQSHWKIKLPLSCGLSSCRSNGTSYSLETIFLRNWQVLNICVLCHSKTETLDYILLQCQFSRAIWNSIRQQLNANTNPDSIFSCGTLVLYVHTFSHRNVWDIAVAATCWELWREQNNMSNPTHTLYFCKCLLVVFIMYKIFKGGGSQSIWHRVRFIYHRWRRGFRIWQGVISYLSSNGTTVVGATCTISGRWFVLLLLSVEGAPPYTCLLLLL